MRNMFSLILFLVSAAHGAPAKTAPVPSNVILSIDGHIYPKDTFPAECNNMLKDVKCSVQSYGQVHIESSKEGDLIHSKQIFSDPDGPQVTEESWAKDGHVKKATLDSRALNKLMELEVVGDKVHYKVTDKRDGSVKTSEDDLDSNLVVPSTVMGYIAPKFADLQAGREVRLRVAVVDRREAFSFVIKKVREEKTASGEDVLVLQMAPTSIIVRAVVDPMYFYLKPKSGELYGFEGKSALRRKEGDKYKELIVKTSYQYNVNQLKSGSNDSTCIEDLTKPNATKCSIQENSAKE